MVTRALKNGRPYRFVVNSVYGVLVAGGEGDVYKRQLRHREAFRSKRGLSFRVYATLRPIAVPVIAR